MYIIETIENAHEIHSFIY